VMVLHDETRIVMVFDGPGRRKAARGHDRPFLGRVRTRKEASPWSLRSAAPRPLTPEESKQALEAKLSCIGKVAFG
jgi:hypothetical protein